MADTGDVLRGNFWSQEASAAWRVWREGERQGIGMSPSLLSMDYGDLEFCSWAYKGLWYKRIIDVPLSEYCKCNQIFL